jgi:hypothetical protein
MIWHDQARDDFAPYDVAFHNFGDVSVRFHGVPDTLGVDDHTGALGAMVEATGLIRTHDIFEV